MGSNPIQAIVLLCFFATIFSCKASSGYLSHLICFACEVLAWVSLITVQQFVAYSDIAYHLRVFQK